MFSAPMVRALLAGTKTQTRRLIPSATLDAYYEYDDWCRSVSAGVPTSRQWEADYFLERSRIQIGDILWVREAWACHWSTDDQKPSEIEPGLWSVRYFADDHIRPAQADGSVARLDQIQRKRPSMFMPRWASRLTLTVDDVRVRRLQEISEADARAEGAYVGKASGRVADNQIAMNLGLWHFTCRDWYEDLWDRINGAGSWEANPWVAAYTFTVERRNIDEGLGQRADAAPKNPLSEGRERS
ncbi:hypothetical protein J2X48_000687 [Bosea sp. BE271]|nr:MULTISPECIES: hypothetical protein [Bosea]MDR6826509.1 hypothetical protein [Bosea robiniae]MDR6893219.1 hypothetical protein [Bosea sp. BE109]MDR7137082.1 hypothetical protein [Bosea sp. BE168]MDR7173781.1 hypothetical protein [Bosea sp. BE271]